MEENERLRHLVHGSGTAPTGSNVVPVLPVEPNLPPPPADQEPHLLDDFTWQLPASQVLEDVQLNGLTIRELFEQYGLPAFGDQRDSH